MKGPWVVADRLNRRLSIHAKEEMTKDMAVYVAKERIGVGWELVTAVFETEKQVNVYFRKNGNLGK